MKFSRTENPPFNDIVVGTNLGLDISLTRGQVLMIQFSKLLNIFPDRTLPSWGGGVEELEPADFTRARVLFESEVMATPGTDCWLYRMDAFSPWGPRNWQLKDAPNPEFGSPFEPYLTINGGLVTINQARRLLGVDSLWLFKLKLHMLLDDLVILECVKKLLRPPPLWAKHERFSGDYLNRGAES